MTTTIDASKIGAYAVLNENGVNAAKINAYAVLAPIPPQELDPPLYNDADTFFSPTVTSIATLTASLYSDADTFFSPTVTPGAVEADPSLYQNTNTFYSPTLVLGEFLSQDSTFQNTNTFFSPTVTSVATLTASLYANSNTFPTQNVNFVIDPNLYSNSNTFYSPIVGVVVQPDLFANSNTFYQQIVTPYALHARSDISLVEQASFTPSVGSLTGVSDLAIATGSGPLLGTATSIVPDDVDPLWIALEVDVVKQVSIPIVAPITTLRIGNRGSLQRTVAGTTYQYSPRLLTDVVIGTRISVATPSDTPHVASERSTSNSNGPFYQQPLRGQPNGGTISWEIDPDGATWFGPSPAAIIGRTFRLYTGRTFNPDYADVDLDLKLIYTGHVANFTFDISSNPPTGTIQTTDASSDLNKSLVDDLYPLDFPVVSLQGLPKPQLIGRKFSIEPVLEDQVSLTFRVTRVDPGVIELGDVTQLTVGGVPWRRGSAVSTFSVDLTRSTANVNAQYAALPSTLKADFDARVSAFPGLYNSATGLQNEVNLVSLLTLYNGLSPADQIAFGVVVASDPILYTTTPAGDLNKIGAIKVNYFGLRQGEYAVNTANGTIQLGSDPGGAAVRVDAYTVDWQTITTAGIVTKICNMANVPVNMISMAQLDLDWNGLVGFYTGTEDVNILNALDRITNSQLCWWNLDASGAVEAGLFDGPSLFPDIVCIGSTPNEILDIGLLSSTAADLVPKMINTFTQTGVVPPAWRARVGYSGNASPQTSFLDGATKEEQTNLSAPELVADWQFGSVGFQLSPTDGDFIRSVNPRAQDVYISSLSNTLADAVSIRERLVQRVIGTQDHQLWSIGVYMDPFKVKLMSTVQVVWVEENNQFRTVYAGTFRVTSAIIVLGGGPQQLELWGLGTLTTQFRPFTSIGPSSDTGSNMTGAGGTSTSSGGGNVLSSITFGAYQVFSDSLAGSNVASLFVTTTNGSVFNGTYSFSNPYLDDSGLVAVAGNFVNGYNLVLARDLTAADVGSHNVTVTATNTQGGGVVSANLTVNVQVSVVSSGRIKYVATNGNDVTGDGTVTKPFATIGKASTIAKAGDTVSVASGTYVGDNYVTAPGVTYMSATKWGAKLVPGSTSAHHTAFYNDRAASVTIDGFLIDGSGANNAQWSSGIYSPLPSGTSGPSSCIVKNCKVLNISTSAPGDPNGAEGIEIDGFYGGQGGTIINNVIGNVGFVTPGSELRHGIYLSAYGTVCQNNIIYGVPGGDGITSWHGASHLTISNNLIFNCEQGILVGSGNVNGAMYSGGNDFTMVFNNIVINADTTGGSPFGVVDGADSGSGGSLGSHNLYSNNCVVNCVTNWLLTMGTHVNDVNTLPTFVSYSADGSGNYHLANGSSCIGQGIASLGGQAAPTANFDGTAVGGVYNIGPY